MDRKRLTSKKGESIAETLVAILIMSLAFLILTGAVATAARVNERARNEDMAFSADPEAKGTINVTLTLDAGTVSDDPSATEPDKFSIVYKPNLYEDNDYYYYKK